MADHGVHANVSLEPPPSTQAGGRVRWRQTFTALKYPNYRLWFFGQMISLFGTWMQSTAQGYLIFELTRSPAYLGYVSFAAGIPSWLFMLYGGVIADRIPKRTVLIVTQTFMMALAFILATLTFLGLVQPWHIVLLAFFLGVANAFDAPARQTLASELVDREDLTNAIALNSTMFNAAVAVGPAVGGLTYAFLGPGWCFTLNGLSFIAVIVGLFLMKTRPQAQPQRPKSTRSDLVEGLRYVLSEPMIRMLIGLIGITSLFGISFATLMPAWAVSILGGDATTNGYLQSARGFGALIGALAIASLGRFTFKGKLLTIGSFAYPLLLLAFAFVHWLPLSLLVLVGAGAGLILVMNLANALVQTLAPDELRGRVMGVYSLIFFGFMPVGGLLMGALAQRVGAPTTVILGASIALAFATLLWALAPKLRAVE